VCVCVCGGVSVEAISSLVCAFENRKPPLLARLFFTSVGSLIPWIRRSQTALWMLEAV